MLQLGQNVSLPGKSHENADILNKKKKLKILTLHMSQ